MSKQTNPNILETRKIFEIDIQSENIPQNVKEYVVWLEQELARESESALRWADKYSKGKRNK